MKIIGFSGSNSSTSINHRLILAAQKEVLKAGHEMDVIRLTDYDIPMFGVDLEEEIGTPEGIIELKKKFEAYDGYIISTPEHNKNIPAFFKNILDWLSRTESKTMEGKPLLLMSTSPGRYGGQNAKELIQKILPYEGGEPSAEFSLPSFNHNFNTELLEITDQELNKEFKAAIAAFLD